MVDTVGIFYRDGAIDSPEFSYYKTSDQFIFLDSEEISTNSYTWDQSQSTLTDHTFGEYIVFDFIEKTFQRNEEGTDITVSGAFVSYDALLDLDSNGVPDGLQIENSNIPNINHSEIDSLIFNKTPEVDSDDDGLPDYVETNTGIYLGESNTGTDPNNPDSDGDGIIDGIEVSYYDNSYSFDPNFNNSGSYDFISGSFTWEEARLDAISRGGHLASITSQAENNIISSAYSARAWIGASDQASEGNFTWVTGEPFIYTPSGFAPDNFTGNQHYLLTNFGGFGSWDDDYLDSLRGYILETQGLHATPSIESITIGLVAYYPFNGNAIDESSNSNGGVVYGATLSTDRYGSANSSYTFDGNDDYIDLGDPDILDLGASNYTYSLWFRANSTESGRYILSKYQSLGTNAFGIGTSTWTGNDYIYSYFAGDNHSDSASSDGTTIIDDGRWHHVVMTLDLQNNKYDLYLDGEQENTVNFSETSSGIDNNYPLLVGKQVNGQNFDGEIDDIRIYARSLSSNEVTTLYESERPTSVPVIHPLESFYESAAGNSVVVDATPTDGWPANFTYQWYYNGFTIPSFLNGINSSYTIEGSESSNGTWAVEVTNDAGTTRSDFVYRVFVDSDGDTISDYRETNLNGTDPNSADTDLDGIADNIETNSGIYLNAADTGTDPNKSDTDDDGLDDLAEISTHSTNPNNSDSDDDGATDSYEVNTSLTNPNDSDSDDDGLSDGLEIYQYSTDPKDADSDGDTLSDYIEVIEIGTNPNSQDSDDDTLLDGAETNTGTWISTSDTGTDPLSNDSDSDGLSDGVETNTGEYIDASDTGTDPNDSDTDNDGLLDGAETNTNVYVSSSNTGTHPLNTDSDADGYSDYVETNTGTWTSSGDTGTDPNRGDTDSDGIIDGRETNTGIYVAVADTGTNPFVTDTDGDGFTDKFEVDASYDPTSASDTPDALTVIRTALEIDIYAADGGVYRVEHTEDLDSNIWTTVEDGIIGNGEIIHRLYSAREHSRRFFRVVRTDQ